MKDQAEKTLTKRQKTILKIAVKLLTTKVSTASIAAIHLATNLYDQASEK